MKIKRKSDVAAGSKFADLPVGAVFVTSAYPGRLYLKTSSVVGDSSNGAKNTFELTANFPCYFLRGDVVSPRNFTLVEDEA